MTTLRIRELVALDQLGELEPLYVALYRHHHSLVEPGLLVADEALSWTRRRSSYANWMAAGEAVVLVAERDDTVVGYALAHLVNGPDDTFAVGHRYAKLYSLSIAPQVRGEGIGTRLLDELDRNLEAAGITDMVVAVMSADVDAMRFYQRRGLIPAETYCWRIAAGSADHHDI